MSSDSDAPPPYTASQRLDAAAAILADALLEAWQKQRRAAKMAGVTEQHRAEQESSDAPAKEAGDFPRWAMERRAALLDAAGIAHALTGAAGAALHGAGPTAVPVTAVRIAPDIPLADAARTLGAERAERGANLRLLRDTEQVGCVGADRREGVAVAPRVRVYLDALGEKRGQDLAQQFREVVLGYRRWEQPRVRPIAHPEAASRGRAGDAELQLRRCARRHRRRSGAVICSSRGPSQGSKSTSAHRTSTCV